MRIFALIFLLAATSSSDFIDVLTSDNMQYYEIIEKEFADDIVDQYFNIYSTFQLYTSLDTSDSSPVRKRFSGSFSNKETQAGVSFADNRNNQLLVSSWVAKHYLSNHNTSIRAGTFSQSLGLGLIVGGAKRSLNIREGDTLSLAGSLLNTYGTKSNGILLQHYNKSKLSLSYSWNEKMATSSVHRTIGKNTSIALIAACDVINILNGSGISMYTRHNIKRLCSIEIETGITARGLAAAFQQTLRHKKSSIQLRAWTISDSFPISTTRGPTLFHGWREPRLNTNGDTLFINRPGESGTSAKLGISGSQFELTFFWGKSFLGSEKKIRTTIESDQTFNISKFRIKSGASIRFDNFETEPYHTSSLRMDALYLHTVKISFRTNHGLAYLSQTRKTYYQNETTAQFTHKGLALEAGSICTYERSRFNAGVVLKEAFAINSMSEINISYKSKPVSELKAALSWHI